jgi:hypothetical protein
MPERDRSKVNANEDDQKRNRTEEHPQRPEPTETIEGPGRRHETRGEEEARNNVTRRGEH